MIYAIDQIKFTTELNLQFIRNGFFVVNDVGILFQNKLIIHTEAQERQNYKIIKQTNLPKYMKKQESWNFKKLIIILTIIDDL